MIDIVYSNLTIFFSKKEKIEFFIFLIKIGKNRKKTKN